MIKKDVDLNSDAWCDLVFEGRNQEYGAYHLRKTSSKRHLFALIIVFVAIIVITITISLTKLFHFDQIQQAGDYELKAIELSNLIGLEESGNSNRAKAEEKPPLKEIAKFAPPTIAEDDSIVEDPEELQETIFAGDSIDGDTFLSLEEDALLLHQKIAQLNQKEESDATATAPDEKNKNAEFPDGHTGLMRYIYQNIHYPPAALKQRIDGRVVCSFIINEDGSISDITLLRGVYVFLDEEVLRVVGSMPSWKPAMKDGKAIKSKCIMPIVFKL